MDAMGLLLTEKLRNLRVKKMKELLFGATIDVEQRNPAKFASVSVVFEMTNNGTVFEKRFTRILFENHCKWEVNSKVGIKVPSQRRGTASAFILLSSDK